MSADLTPYPQELYIHGDYNLLRIERELIKKVLISTKYDLKKSYKILCPPGNALYVYRTFKVKIIRHNIKLPKSVVINAK